MSRRNLWPCVIQPQCVHAPPTHIRPSHSVMDEKRWVCTPQHDALADDGAHSGSSFVGAILFRCMEVRSGTFGDRRVVVPWLAFVIPRVDGSWSRKRHRIFTAPRPPDCGGHNASLHRPENIAGREGCRRPREHRMPRSRADGTFFPGRMRAVQLDMHTL